MTSYCRNSINFESKWPWWSRSMTSVFNTSWEYPRIHVCLAQILMIVAQIYDDFSHKQAKFPRILSLNGQNYLEGQGQWPPFSIPDASIPGCMLGANLVILAQIYDQLRYEQAEFPRIMRQNGQYFLEGQGQWPLLSILNEGIPWCMFCANLVIPAQICDELSCGQNKV